MSNYHFNGYNCSLFDGQRFALNPNSLSMAGNSTEIFVAPGAQADQVKPNYSIAGIICNRKKRGGSAVGDRLFHCKRQRRKGCTSWETITLLPEHDGSLWRKYGEKKTINNQHRRSYYKCAYKKEYNCKATKQVQQRDNSDSPVPIYNVTYFHDHVCPFSCSNYSKSQSTMSRQIILLDFAANAVASSVPAATATTPPRRFVQEHSGLIKKEISTDDVDREMLMECCSDCAAKEEEAGQRIEPTVNASDIDQLEKQYSHMLSPDQYCWIDNSNELNAVIYGVQKSESVGSNLI